MAMGISEAVPLHKMLLLRIHSSQNLTQYVLAVDISWSTTIKKPVLLSILQGYNPNTPDQKIYVTADKKITVASPPSPGHP
jgi:hypothetical protein